MFILLETEDELPYALEVFYDLEKKEYYFNMVTSYEQEVFDVFIGEKLTILIGNDLHSIIENSIYHRFYENEKQFFFHQVDLIQLNRLELPWGKQMKIGYPFENGLFKSMKLQYDETYMVSISGKEVNLFIYKNIQLCIRNNIKYIVSPWVLCTAENTMKEFYLLRMKSQQCPSMKYTNNSPFIICDSNINFSFQGQEVYFYEENSKLFMIIVGVVMFIIIGLSIILLIYKNRYQKLSILEEQSSLQVPEREESYLKTENIPTLK